MRAKPNSGRKEGMTKPGSFSISAHDRQRNSDQSTDYNPAAAFSATQRSREGFKAVVSRSASPGVSGNAHEVAQAADETTKGGATHSQAEPQQTEDGNSTPICIPIPKSMDLPVALDGSRGAAAESFSILRSRLLSVHKKLGIRSVIITSAEAGDGKTLVATNLSLSLGQLGTKRILLVDGDLRIGKVSEIFNVGQRLGISDFLQGDATFRSVICPTELRTLALVPAGTAAKNVVSGLLQGPRWPAFIEKAKEEFDLIVIDTIPVSAPVVDLELLSEPCDAELLVVRMRQTNRQALKRAASRMNASKFLGVVMNNADEVCEYDYGYLDAEH